MTSTYSLNMPRSYDIDPADASLTGFASNVTGAAWTLAANSSGDGLAHRVSIRNDSGNSKAAINITLVGIDQNGMPLTEVLAGPGASATVESVGYFLQLISATPAATWGADTGDIGWVDEVQLPWINLNWASEDAVTINATVTGTINFTVQETFDRTELVGSPAPTWRDLIAAGAASVEGQSTGGATAIRVIVNSYTNGAEIKLTVNATRMPLPAS